jgi:ketosteroid isomerase-like protein
MSEALDLVRQAYGLARRADHRTLRTLIADDATWHPAREGAWNPCPDGDWIVRTMLWRAGPANKMRPGQTFELGNSVLIEVKGKRMKRLGAKSYFGNLWQIVEVRNGKIVRMQDYPGREEGLAAAGLQA